MKRYKFFELVTCTATKPWLSINMLPNINICENVCSNFSTNLRVVALKFIELTQFAIPNYQFTLISYMQFFSVTSSRGLVFQCHLLISTPCVYQTATCNGIQHLSRSQATRVREGVPKKQDPSNNGSKIVLNHLHMDQGQSCD